MGINKGERFDQEDIYVDYEFERVMFRYEHKGKKIYRKFYGEQEEAQPVPFDNRLFNDALLYGIEITLEEYNNNRGK